MIPKRTENPGWRPTQKRPFSRLEGGGREKGTAQRQGKKSRYHGSPTTSHLELRKRSSERSREKSRSVVLSSQIFPGGFWGDIASPCASRERPRRGSKGQRLKGP